MIGVVHVDLRMNRSCKGRYSRLGARVRGQRREGRLWLGAQADGVMGDQDEED